MTYAVFDPASRTMTYARAGHTPLMHVTGADNEGRRVDILTPDGMVLGLHLDRGERFDSILQEATLNLTPGDRLVFFTDGISEAMNDDGDCFGEPRLVQLLEDHAHLAGDELRERIVREVEAFVGGAAQHDDMTFILIEAGGDERSDSLHA